MDKFEEFYEAHKDADGNLSDVDAARMLMLPVGEGDTSAGIKPPLEGSEPAATPEAKTDGAVVVAEPAKVPPAEPVPVLLAKDGVHTIEYQKLVDAREAAKHWEKVAAEATAAAVALKKAPVAPAVEPAAPKTKEGEPAAAALPADIFGDYSEEALSAGVTKLVDIKVAAITADLEAKFASALAPVQAKEATDAAEAHYRQIYTAHPDVESVVESAELKAFLGKQPSFVRAQYENVLKEGSAAEVVELLDAYRLVNPKVAAPAEAGTAAKAKEIVAAAKAAAPTSLSDIPAGSAAHHDEVGAIREMSDAALAGKFASKSPEQIKELLNRLI
ncbi:hypothetical protein [Variovorax boronicumulans]|uniref:hypothetical protein n=1 Tax=Variovorax boronicumulans TaxID=436515 RepID=UPI00133058BC|nr:hypothetical protein [Variovorax boronicumulans]